MEHNNTKEAGDMWMDAASVMPDIGYFQTMLGDDDESAGGCGDDGVNADDDDENEDAWSKLSAATKSSRRAHGPGGDAEGAAASSGGGPTPKKGKGPAKDRWWDRDAQVAALDKSLSSKADAFAMELDQLSKRVVEVKSRVEADDKLARIESESHMCPSG